MKKELAATLTNGNNTFNYFTVLDDPSVIRIDEEGNEVAFPDWSGDILTEDLENLDIIFLSKDAIEYYLNDEDIKDSWSDPEKVLNKIHAYLNHKAVFVLGLKWFDKVNGNTYCRPVVILENGDRITCDYKYGYGDQYMEYARKLCQENGVTYVCPAHTDKWVSKKELKNKLFF